MMDFDFYADLEERANVNALFYALSSRNFKKAARLVDEIKTPLVGSDASRLLTEGFSCAPELFRKLLGKCDSAEHSGYLDVDAVDGKKYYVRGSATVLAAAGGYYEHLKTLLDAGCDVNGASEIAEDELANSPGPYYMGIRNAWNPVFDSFHDRTGLIMNGFGALHAPKDSSIRTWPGNYNFGNMHPPGIEGVTPLAAAVFFGRTDCVRLLLGCSGVWVRRCSSVTSALFCGIRGDDYEKAKALVYDALKHSGPDGGPGELAVCSMTRYAELPEFKKELERYPYSDDEIAGAAEMAAVSLCPQFYEMNVDRTPYMQKLLFTESLRPSVFDSDYMLQVLLVLCSFYRGLDKTNLTELLKRHLPDVTDLSRLLAGSNFYGNGITELVRSISEHTRCVFSRYAIGFGLRVSDFYMLGRYAEMLPAKYDDEGISGLTASILSKNSLKLFRFAAKKGWLNERRDIMLKYLMEDRSDILRPAILGLPPVSEPVEIPDDAEDPEKGIFRWVPGRNEAFSLINRPLKDDLDEEDGA